MAFVLFRSAALIVAMILTTPSSARLQEQPTEEQMREFLLTAKIVGSRRIGKGKTSPYRLTLDNGTMTHDAAFQPVDEYKPSIRFDNGNTEMNFRDSYKYSIAAFELAKLLGLGDMMPVTVERKWRGKSGALSWWLPVKMDERQSISKGIHPPDIEAWNRQMHRMRVFSQLVYDTDRNLGNTLISEDWRLWMIDLTRAFRLYHTLENPRNLERCDRRLFERLQQLDTDELKEKTAGFLNSLEIEGVMARRDKIIGHFVELARQKGDSAVFY